MSWGDLYGLIITATGWTTREVDATPWPGVVDLLDYWKHHPPIHVLTHGFFLGNTKGGKVVESASEDELRAAIAGF